MYYILAIIAMIVVIPAVIITMMYFKNVMDLAHTELKCEALFKDYYKDYDYIKVTQFVIHNPNVGRYLDLRLQHRAVVIVNKAKIFIGCEQKSEQEWINFFEDEESIETPTDSEKFKTIKDLFYTSINHYHEEITRKAS